MRVRVLYFGVLKDLMKAERSVVELADGSTVANLLGVIEANGAVSPDLWRSIAVAVNHEYVQGTVALRDDDEVALLPPVSGGVGKNGNDAR